MQMVVCRGGLHKVNEELTNRGFPLNLSGGVIKVCVQLSQLACSWCSSWLGILVVCMRWKHHKMETCQCVQLASSNCLCDVWQNLEMPTVLAWTSRCHWPSVKPVFHSV